MTQKTRIPITIAMLLLPTISGASTILVTPGSVAGYVYLPKEESLHSSNTTISGVQLCTIVSEGYTEIYVGETPPKADITVDYLIAGGGAGSGGGSYLGAAIKQVMFSGQDGERKRGTFTIASGSTDTIQLYVGGGGSAGSGMVIDTVGNQCGATMGGGGGGGAGLYSGGSGQLGTTKIQSLYCYDILGHTSGGGGGGSSGIVINGQLIAGANGGDAQDDPTTGIHGGKGATVTANGSGYCTYSVNAHAPSPACGSSSGWGSASFPGGPLGAGGSSTTPGMNNYNRVPYAVRCVNGSVIPVGSRGDDGAAGLTTQNANCYSQTAGGLGARSLGDGSSTFMDAGRGATSSHKGGNSGMVVLKYYNDFCFPFKNFSN